MTRITLSTRGKNGITSAEAIANGESVPFEGREPPVIGQSGLIENERCGSGTARSTETMADEPARHG